MYGPYARGGRGRSSRSGVSACWNWQTAAGRLGPVDLVDDPEPVGPLVVLLDRRCSATTLSMSRVIRSSTDRPASGIAARLAPGRAARAAGLRPALGPGVLEAVVVALVAVDRGGRGLEREELSQKRSARSSTARSGSRSRSALRVRAGTVPAAWPGPRDVGVEGTAVAPERAAALSPRTAASARRSARRPGRGRGTARGPEVAPSRRAQSRRWFHLRMCQLPRSIASRSSGERSSLWRTSSVRSGSDDEEPDEPVVLRDPGVAPQDRLAEHRGPLDLEQERHAAADVPDAVDVLQVPRRRPAEVGGSARARARRASRRGVQPPTLRACSRRPIQTRIPRRWPPSARRAISSACSWARRSRSSPVDEPVRACWRGCGSSRGRPGRAPRPAGRGRRTAPRSARRTPARTSGPAVESRLNTAHSTRSASGAAAAVAILAVGRATSGRARPRSSRRRSTGRARRLEEPPPDESWPGPAASARVAGLAAGRAAVRRDRRRRRGGRRRRRGSSAPPRAGRPEEAPQLAGAIQADEDLAEQPLVAGRLAAGLDRLDRDVGDGPRGVLARTAGGRSAPDRRTGRPRARCPGRPRRPEPRRAATLARVRGPRGRRPSPGGTSSIVPVTSSRRPRAAPGRGGTRPPTPPSAAATSPSAPPQSTRNTTRPSRAIAGSTEASERPSAVACQPHGAPDGAAEQASIGRIDAASRPRTQAVAQYASDSRSWFGRTGGWPRTSRTPRPPARGRRRRASPPASPAPRIAPPTVRRRRGPRSRSRR